MEYLFYLISPLFAYAIASTFESFFHDQVLDISSRRASFFFRIRKFAPGFWNSHFAHGVLHHHKTFVGSYTRQFNSADERFRLIDRLKKNFDQTTVDDFCADRFGITFIWKGYIFYALPIYLPPALLAPYVDNAGMIFISLSFLIFASPFFILSKWIHPYLHMTFNEMIKTAPSWIRWFLTTDYGVAIRISHWVHHKHPKYNLNLQYGADLLRKRFRPPSETEYDELVSEGVILRSHRERFDGKLFLGHQF